MKRTRPIPTPTVNSEQLEIITNAVERSMLASRLDLMGALGTTHGGKRDLYGIFGYKAQITPADILFKYSRQDIAERIANAYPDAIWSNPPEVIDDPDSQEETEFEKAFRLIAKRLKLWHYLGRVDTLSQLGRYAILIIGVEGSGELSQARPKASKVKYLMPYGEASANIQKFESDVSNERFGKPSLYQVTLVDVSDGNKGSSGGKLTSTGKTIDVHHSRTIHVAEGLLDNDVYGRSILESIYNRLDDLEKVVGGGAEIYWINARAGLNLNVAKDASIKDPEKMAQEADDYVNQLSRILKTKGMDVKVLTSPTDSPKDQIDAILQLISGATGIPKRILTGSEMGQLASNQDEDNWLSRVDERRVNHCEPALIYPIVDLLISTGDLPAPKNGEYIVKWPDLIALSEDKIADIAVKKSQAIATYINSMGADLLVTPQQFVEEVLNMEYREVEIAQLEEEQMKQDEEEAAKLEQTIKRTGIHPVTGKPVPPPIPQKTKIPSTKPVKTIANQGND